jgi:hypothetical protein
MRENRTSGTVRGVPSNRHSYRGSRLRCAVEFIRRIFLTIAASFILTSCAGGVVSKNIVGLNEYKLDVKQIDGIWINNKGAVLLKTIDAEKGIVKVTLLQDSEDIVNIGPLIYQVMKGDSWLYFNVLTEIKNKEKAQLNEAPRDEDKLLDKDRHYRWGRIIIDDDKIILWEPSMTAFIGAIDAKEIVGNYNKKLNDDGTYEINTVHITDSAENIVKLIEQDNKIYFIWDNPDFFIKLTK